MGRTAPVGEVGPGEDAIPRAEEAAGAASPEGARGVDPARSEDHRRSPAAAQHAARAHARLEAREAEERPPRAGRRGYRLPEDAASAPAGPPWPGAVPAGGAEPRAPAEVQADGGATTGHADNSAAAGQTDTSAATGQADTPAGAGPARAPTAGGQADSPAAGGTPRTDAQRREYLAALGVKPEHLAKAPSAKLERAVAQVEAARARPGAHKLTLDLGKKYQLEIKVGADGQLDDARAKEKKGFWGKLGTALKVAAPIAAKVLAPVTGGLSLVAYAAYSAVEAARKKDWLALATSVAGGVSGLASFAARAGSQATGLARAALGSGFQRAGAWAQNAGRALAGAGAARQAVRGRDPGLLASVAGEALGAAGPAGGQVQRLGSGLATGGRLASAGLSGARALRQGDVLGAAGSGLAGAGALVEQRPLLDAARAGVDLAQAVRRRDALGAGQALDALGGSLRSFQEERRAARQRAQAWAELPEQAGPAALAEAASGMFDRLDADADGRLSRRELDRALTDDGIRGLDAAAVAALVRARGTLERLYDDRPGAEGGISRRDLGALSARPDGRVAREVNGAWRYAADRLSAADRQLFAADPRADAVAQGAAGDCYLLAAVAARAAQNPAAVRSMVQANPDGSYTVRFPGRAPVQVDALSDGELARYTSGGANGLWPAVLEKAYGQIRQGQGPRRDRPWQERTTSGRLDEGIGAVTGRPARYEDLSVSTAADTRQALAGALGGRRVVTAQTGPTPGLAGLVGGHAYSILAYDRATDRVSLRNPWGFFEPGSGSRAGARDGADDGRFSLSLAEFRRRFTHVAYER